MAKKVSLTPAQIALAQADFSETPGSGAAGDGDAYLEEIQEHETASTATEEPPSGTDADTRDYYEQAAAGDLRPEEVEDQTIKTGISEEDPSWLTDDLRNYALSYGLKEDDLEQFKSAEELQRFGDATDRRQAQARYQQYQEPEPKKQEPPADSEAAAETAETSDGEVDYDALMAKMEEDNYDDVTKEFLRVSKSQAEKIKLQSEKIKDLEKRDLEREEAAKKAAEEQKVAAEILEVDKVLDGVDPTIFGTAFKDGRQVNLPPVFDENRRAVFGEYVFLKRQMAERGITDIPTELLVERARRTVFGGTPVTERVEAQSRRRRPTGANRGQNGGVSPPVRQTANEDDDVSAIAQSPKMRAFWEKTQRVNGQV